MQGVDKQYVLFIYLFALLAGIYLAFNKTDHVLWEIYAFTLKDALISAFAINIAKRSKLLIAHFSTIALVSYLSAPMCIRLYCALETSFIYKPYRLALKNNTFKFILMLILFTFFSLIYVEILRYDKKRKRRAAR